jgi:hypothetical protein
MSTENEYYTDNIEYPNIDKLNEETAKKMFNDYEFEAKDINNLSEKEFNKNLNKFIKPDQNINSIDYYTEETYLQKKTDPYKRILELKNDLINNKNEIDDSIKKFNNLSFITNTNNYSLLFNNSNSIKNKVDAFINYNYFNSLDEIESDSEEKDDLSSENSGNEGEEKEKKKEEKKTKEKVYSIFGKYTRISENLLNKLKNINNDILNNEIKNQQIIYKLNSNPDNQLIILNNKLNELGNLITNLEKTIGNWNLSKNEGSITNTLINLINFLTSKSLERYDIKYQLLKSFGNLIQNFYEINNERIDAGLIFTNIKEIYSILEIEKEFKDLLIYLKNRIDGIKEINNFSNQFNNALEKLQDLILRNSEDLIVLNKTYLETLEVFTLLQTVLKQLNDFDNKIKSKI